MNKAIFFLMFVLFTLSCSGEVSFVKIDEDVLIKESDLPEYSFYLSEDSFFNFLDSIVDEKVLLIGAEREGLPEKLAFEFNDIKRVLILDSLWSVLEDSFIRNQDSLAYFYWLASQKTMKLYAIRLPVDFITQAEMVSEIADSLIKNDTIGLDHFVDSITDLYDFTHLFRGPAGDLKWIFASVFTSNLGYHILNQPDFSSSQPIATDSGVFIFIRLASRDAPYIGDFEDIKEIILEDYRGRFIFEQSDMFINRLRSEYEINYNEEALRKISTYYPFQRLEEEDPVILPDYDENLSEMWVLEFHRNNYFDTLYCKDIFKRLKTGRILYPNLSDTNFLKLFIARDILPPLFLEREGVNRNIHLSDDIQQRFKEVKDSILIDYYITSKSGSDFDSVEIYLFYDTNQDLFKIPERLELSIIGVVDSQLAQKLYDTLLLGGDFEVIARSQSELPSALNGGDLGIVRRGRYRPEIDSMIFSLHEEELSPVLFMDGFHVIMKVSGYKPDSLLPFYEVFDRASYLYEKTLREKIKELLLDDLKKQFQIVIDSTSIRNILKKKKEDI